VTSLSHWVKQTAAAAGFDLAGVAAVREFAELEYFPQWIADGHAAEMRYLESRTEAGALKRASLRHVAPWARSVIVCAINYNTAEPYSVTQHDPTRAWISRYAWTTRDYHDAVLERLREIERKLRAEISADAEVRCYVDTGPLVERVYAKYAGVGWIGKNTCVINQGIGSWLFLGVILTSLELEPDLPAPDRCGSCTRCLDACPTDAFLGPYQLDAARCISYLTIEKRGAIPTDLRSGIGKQVFGCDICQDVCPWNRKAPATEAADFQPRPELVNPALDWLATLTEEGYRDTFRGSPLKRAKRSGLHRNAVVAMGNSANRQYIPLLEKLVADADESLAEHARWALDKLRETTGQPERS